MMIRSLPNPNFIGYGTVDEPYLIFSGSSLKNMADLINSGGGQNKYWKLMNTIRLEDYVSGTGWTPIGSIAQNKFNGDFNGNGKYIESLNINTDVGTSGLFGFVGTANIYDLKIVSGEINCNIGGAIVGQSFNFGLHIDRCVNNINVTGYSLAGGIIGYKASIDTVRNCYNSGAISTTYDNITARVGGICGISLASNVGEVERCWNYGLISKVNGISGAITGGFLALKNPRYCYYNYQTSGSVMPNVEYSGTGLTTAQMKGLSVNNYMTQLDYTNIWRKQAVGYPVLKVFDFGGG